MRGTDSNGPSALLATAQTLNVITLRLLATCGFPAIRNTNGTIAWFLVCIPHSGPSALLATAQTLNAYSLAPLILMPGPMVEATVQLLIY